MAKLTRVAMLAPTVIGLGFMARRKASDKTAARPPMPWFVAAFIAVVGLNSLVAEGSPTKRNLRGASLSEVGTRTGSTRVDGSHDAVVVIAVDAIRRSWPSTKTVTAGY